MDGKPEHADAFKIFKQVMTMIQNKIDCGNQNMKKLNENIS